MPNSTADQTPTNNPTKADATVKTTTASSSSASAASTHPEHEPLAFHFGNFQEALSGIEQRESPQNPEALPSPLRDQLYSPPIIHPTTTITQPAASAASTVNTHPPLPLSDAEIEKNAHSKKEDDSIHWLALWCIRQLEIYEKGLGRSQ